MAEGKENDESKIKMFKVTVKMKKPWVDVDSWYEKPTKENVIERFFDELQHANVDELFEVEIEETTKE